MIVVIIIISSILVLSSKRVTVTNDRNSFMSEALNTINMCECFRWLMYPYMIYKNRL